MTYYVEQGLLRIMTCMSSSLVDSAYHLPQNFEHGYDQGHHYH